MAPRLADDDRVRKQRTSRDKSSFRKSALLLGRPASREHVPPSQITLCDSTRAGIAQLGHSTGERASAIRMGQDGVWVSGPRGFTFFGDAGGRTLADATLAIAVRLAQLCCSRKPMTSWETAWGSRGQNRAKS
jgi:hypothetical protein